MSGALESGRPVWVPRASPRDLALDPGFCRLLAGSHARIVGSPLLPQDWSDRRAARWLYAASPVCLLAHDADDDPRFIYGNKAAQACFEYEWEELILRRSRLSAEAPDRAERQRLLEAVGRQGFVSGYRGLRVARSGRRFWIEDATVWQLVDEAGVLHGQAATFLRWRDA